MSKTVTMYPVVMRVPNGEGIYAPSKLSKPKKISRDEFLEKYSSNPIQIMVSFEKDGISDPIPVRCYALDWYYYLKQERKVSITIKGRIKLIRSVLKRYPETADLEEKEWQKILEHILNLSSMPPGWVEKNVKKNREIL